ncbi:diguanylate cyclase [Shewanella sp. Isolate11]|uniref:diguanylate cyclase domain-containing protein n=1 Tax=Shewanella sp. Isolate11 TaxID=2908530 RepID=UPI001EFEA768|nr:diguanylate cyclase [Shewanella sp. Isolate11]MCG9696944.1 sensor domain-containing diguanylate cyclase [Shewanella sp. Isolate11]
MDTYLADSLATVITIDPNFAIQNWETIASKLLQKAQYVRNVGLAPNNVIQYIYPLTGNEAAIGLDFKTVPEQMRTVDLARQRQKVYIAGPVNLVQGGKGLIARFPIFSDFPVNQHYWGTISVVMDYDALITETGLNSFKGAKIAIKKPQLANEEAHVVYGDKAIFEQADVVYPIRLPGETWQLMAQFSLDAHKQTIATRHLIVTIGALVTLLLYVVMILLYRHYKHTHKAALQDELTHLPNRRFMISLLNRLMNDNKQPSFALLNIDLNDFKQVNDDLGHEAGDELLKHIAKLLQEVAGKENTVARFGGDEFLVLMKNIASQSEVDEMIAKIRYSVESSVLLWEKNHIAPSLSIGFAIYDSQIATVKQLLSQADKSMYAHKKQERLKA